MIDWSRCESPLERALGEALVSAIGDGLLETDDAGIGVVGVVPAWRAALLQQTPLKWCRPDYMFVSLDRVAALKLGAQGMCLPADNTVVIEVDGHDFHERTKEQARRDRSRDRAMLELGWHPIRFTGLEVHQDAQGCARQALRAFLGRQVKLLGERQLLAERALSELHEGSAK